MTETKQLPFWWIVALVLLLGGIYAVMRLMLGCRLDTVLLAEAVALALWGVAANIATSRHKK